MARIDLCCPHCNQEIAVHMQVKTPEAWPKGPAPYDYGIEIDSFIIEKIKEGLSLPKVGKLLADRGISPPRGGKWYAASVKRAHKQALARQELRNPQLFE